MQAFFYNFRLTGDNVPFCSAEVRRWVAAQTNENQTSKREENLKTCKKCASISVHKPAKHNEILGPLFIGQLFMVRRRHLEIISRVYIDKTDSPNQSEIAKTKKDNRHQINPARVKIEFTVWKCCVNILLCTGFCVPLVWPCLDRNPVLVPSLGTYHHLCQVI